MQIPTERSTYSSDCNPSRNTDQSRSPQSVIDQTVPTWTVGLLIHLVLALLALAAAVRAVRTPARRLARGTRIA